MHNPRCSPCVCSFILVRMSKVFVIWRREHRIQSPRIIGTPPRGRLSVTSAPILPRTLGKKSSTTHSRPAPRSDPLRLPTIQDLSAKLYAGHVLLLEHIDLSEIDRDVKRLTHEQKHDTFFNLRVYKRVNCAHLLIQTFCLHSGVLGHMVGP